MRKIIIEDRIFEVFPKFIRGIVIIEDIENSAENKEVEGLLSAIVEKRSKEDNLSNPLVKAWDEAHRKFGSNPNKYPPSIKALLKRVQKKGNLPFINSVVALFNYISLKYLIPCGGDDVKKIKGNLKLGFAKGDELFTPLGSRDVEHPQPDEVIYFDDQTKVVMCRRWNWRNGDFTKITEESKKIVVNIDGMYPADQKLIITARDELASLAEKKCKAKVSKSLLYVENPTIEIPF